ncbi:MAG: hypothetical protein ACYC0X_23495 [Pirellulaceae bacterium]
MNTRCVRQGQVEIGVIEHDGHEFPAFGATVVGHQITAYTRRRNGRISLTTWNGQTMLACRCEMVGSYWDGVALVFTLPRGRFIAGYALGDDGMLFRGEILDTGTLEEATTAAVAISDYYSEQDAEDEEADWDVQ